MNLKIFKVCRRQIYTPVLQRQPLFGPESRLPKSNLLIQVQPSLKYLLPPFEKEKGPHQWLRLPCIIDREDGARIVSLPIQSSPLIVLKMNTTFSRNILYVRHAVKGAGLALHLAHYQDPLLVSLFLIIRFRRIVSRRKIESPFRDIIYKLCAIRLVRPEAGQVEASLLD